MLGHLGFGRIFLGGWGCGMQWKRGRDREENSLFPMELRWRLLRFWGVCSQRMPLCCCLLLTGLKSHLFLYNWKSETLLFVFVRVALVIRIHRSDIRFSKQLSKAASFMCLVPVPFFLYCCLFCSYMLLLLECVCLCRATWMLMPWSWRNKMWASVSLD